MTIKKSVIIDLSTELILKNVKELQNQRNLSSDDMEAVLYRVLNHIKDEKNKEYSNTIFDLTLEIQQKDKQLEELNADASKAE